MIVVTDAAGFIGSNVVAELEERSVGPIVLADWFGSDERWRNIAKRRVAAIVAPEDIMEWLNNNARQTRAVIHMGAVSPTTERNVDKLVKHNLNFTVALWDWCAHHQVPYLYASSAATYGENRT